MPWDSAPTRDNFFGGDLTGIRTKLPYLADLGVTALYLTPIFRAGSNHRYDTHDYLEVDPALGDNEVFKDLVTAAHELGIHVVLDGVFNHVGDGFWAFRDLVERGPDSPCRDWFLVSTFPIRSDPPTYQTCGGAPSLPKLNAANPETRRYLLDVAAHWIREADIDGWRLDVPWKVPTDFWHEFAGVVKESKPDAYLIAEAWNVWGSLPQTFDGLMNYRLRTRLLDFCVNDTSDAEDLAVDTETLFSECPDPTLMLNPLGSHDTPRLMTLAAGDERRVILAFVAVLTYPGAPMIYYGDEIGLMGGSDPDCRGPMTWEEKMWRGSVRDAVRRLIALRRRHAALRRGRWEPILAFNRLFAYRRETQSDEVVVVINAGSAASDVDLPFRSNDVGVLCDELTGETYPAEGGRIHFGRFPEYSAAVLVPRR